MGDRNSLDFRVTYHGGSVSEPQNEAWRTEVVGDQGAPDAEYAVGVLPQVQRARKDDSWSG